MSISDDLGPLIADIQAGADRLPELWAAVEDLVKWWGNRLLQKLRGVEFDEYISAGYLAMCEAVKTFDGSGSFPNWLHLYFLSEVARSTQYRSARQQKDPLHGAVSLSTPLGDEGDDLTLGDTVAAPDAYEGADARIWCEQLHAELEAALAKLPADQQDVLRRCFFSEQTLKEVGETLRVAPQYVHQVKSKALRRLRRPDVRMRLQGFLHPDGERRIDEKTDFYRHVGVDRYGQTGTSSVEELVLQRERWRQEERKIDRLIADSHRETERLLNERPWLRERLDKMRAVGDINV